MPVKLSLKYKDSRVGVYVRILFLRFELYANKKQEIKKSDFKIKRFRKRRDKTLKKYRMKKASKKTVKKETGKKHNSPITLIRSLKLILWDAFTLFGKHLKFNKFNISVKVGGSDAAKTALNYGYTVQALQYLVTYLEMISNLDKAKKKSAEVNASFTDGKWDASVNIVLSLRVIHILKIGFSALSGYLKYKNKNKAVKGR
jgi:hypothetical protein